MLLFLLSVAFLLAIDEIKIGETLTSSEEDLCDQCTNCVNGSLDDARPVMVKSGDMEFTTPDPCVPCTLAGYSNMQLNSQVCPKAVEEGGETCYDHPLKVFFKQLTMKCTCTLPFNPMDIPKLMMTKAEDPTKGLMCTQNSGQPPFDQDVMEASGSQMSKTDPAGLAKLSECRPVLPKFGMSPPTSVTGGVKGLFDDFQLTAVIRKCPNKPAAVKKLIPDTSIKIKGRFTCASDVDPSFMAPCECFCKTGFLDQMLVAMAMNVIPCLGGERINQDKDLLSTLTCNQLMM